MPKNAQMQSCPEPKRYVGSDILVWGATIHVTTSCYSIESINNPKLMMGDTEHSNDNNDDDGKFMKTEE
jgi:hypothetical protein